MKKIGIVLIFIALVFQVSGQEPVKEKIDENRSAAVSDTNENTKVIIGENLVAVEDSKDAFKVRVGNRGLNILESLEGKKVMWEKFNDTASPFKEKDEEKNEKSDNGRRHFRGHWSGLEIGLNNYTTSGNSMVLPSDINYMNLNSSKSINFNLNLPQISIGFTRHVGLVTGLGINWNNYRFEGNNSIEKDINGMIVPLTPNGILKKSKLATVYLTLPLLLEMQLPVENHHFNVAAGFIGALKLGSHTKMVMEGAHDIKSFDDFNLNLMRYGATARVGYGNLQLYGTYYLTPLFEKGMGPGGYDLFPFEIGISLSCFN
jgi:hypothetical protein